MSRTKYGGRQKGTPNRISASIREHLKDILEECIDTIELEELSTLERLKLIQMCLQYTVTKPKSENEPVNKKLFEIVIIDSKCP
jgi:hypothetical protein